MTEKSVGDLVEILILIRERVKYGLNSDEAGARNALNRIAKLCNEALSSSSEESNT